MSDIYFRVFVGPKFEAGQAFWTTYDLNEASAPDYSTAVGTTLTSGTMTVTTGSATTLFASAGGIWIAPNGTGQAWEYCAYSGKTINSFTGLTREDSTYREHNGVHTAGAQILQWMPVETDNGTLRIVRDLNDELCATTWYAELAGVAFPQRCLRNEHVVIVQTATAYAGPYTNALVGWLDSPAVADTGDRRGEWRVRIMCIAEMVGYTQARGVRVGAWDVAREASASSSPTIPGAWKELGATGFDGTLRTFDASNAIDGNPNTFWISDQMVGTYNSPEVSDFHGIEQMYINPAASLGTKGNRWIAISNIDLLNQNLLWLYNTANDTYHSLDLSDLPGEIDDNEYVIICENEALFMANNPSASPLAVLETEAADDNDNIFTHFDPAGGAVVLKYSDPFTTSYTSMLCWGTQDEVPDGDAFSGDGGADWDVGTSIDAPGRGETMRRAHNTTPTPSTEADYWITGFQSSPAYQIDTDPFAGWLKLDLPAMEIELATDITSGATSFTVRWGDTLSSDGLPATGTILVDEEEITYTTKNATGVSGATRGANGTAAVAHLEGTKVRIVQSADDDVATDGYPLRAVGWVVDSGSTTPRDFDFLLTGRTDARAPTANNYGFDYVTQELFEDYTDDDKTHTLSPALHVKTFLFQTGECNLNPMRPRLTSLFCLVDETYFDSDYWLFDDETVEETLEQLAVNAGVHTDAVSVTAGGLVLTDHTTAAGAAWAVLSDLADYGNAYIAMALDSKMTMRPNWIWTTAVGGYTSTYTWDDDDVVRVEKTWRRGGDVGQVRLNWVDQDGVEQAQVSYPTTQGAGRIEEIGPYVFASEAAATLAARKRFHLGKYPYTALAQLDEGDLAVNVGAVASLTWQFDDEMQPIDRLYLVKSVEHVIEQGALTTTCHLLEIDREAP